MHVEELSEGELLARMFPLLPGGRSTLIGPGDDAAVLAAGGDVVVTTDVLVQDLHFRMAWSTGYDVGWRAAVANLADVLAMGARPTALVVALTLPGDTPVAWVEDLARGLAGACAPHGVGVVGGDLSGGSQLTVAVTALGDLDGRPPVLRSGARVGDTVAVAGPLGRSAAGLALLAARDAGLTWPDGAQALVGAHLRPDPPLGAGLDAARGGASALMDISDGLLRDAGRLAAASGVRIDLDSVALTPDAEALEVAAQMLDADPLAWVLTGGEDHALLATFGPGAPPAPFRAIGEALPVDAAAPGGAPSVTVDGAAWAGPTSGWDHFAG